MTTNSNTKEIAIGTRGSRLAIWQANHVVALLAEHGVASRLEIITTKGDQDQSTPLPEIGDKGFFTAELDAALIDGRIDLAVHSLKDLPTRLPEELVLVAIPPRGTPWDVLVARANEIDDLAALPKGARVGTSSLRRAAQLLATRPDLDIQPLRGNVETRLRKLEEGEYDAIILAEAGLLRLGLVQRVSFRFALPEMTPAVGQGALGIVCSAASDLGELLRMKLNDARTEHAVAAERAFLQRLEGGCQIPVGGYARLEGDTLHLTGCVASVDGTLVYRDSMSGSADAGERVGVRLAEWLIEKGAGRILAELRLQKT